ncbi:MAG: hypothetical protein JWM27_4492 [Gemmatimonadetes bacterium]|nr:hypothetical protein [Gemmatimonadota bacterium]
MLMKQQQFFVLLKHLLSGIIGQDAVEVECYAKLLLLVVNEARIEDEAGRKAPLHGCVHIRWVR